VVFESQVQLSALVEIIFEKFRTDSDNLGAKVVESGEVHGNYNGC
jgi:hypothetical protein